MPFMKKTDGKGTEPPADARKIFVGRSDKLDFFLQNILKPEEPAYNIVAVIGNGGVGKSTLLAQFIEKAHTGEFKEYCLTALVDERESTPASVMEKFAEQLRTAGYPLERFEKELAHYKETLRKLQTEREAGREALLRKVLPDLAGSVVKHVPVAGSILEEGVKTATGLLLDEQRYHQLLKDAERLENPTRNLTRTFVEDLNHLADMPVTLSTSRAKHQRRVLLFFDTFERLASVIAPWLLDYLLEANVNSNIVLILAGRDPLERSIPDNPKRWLPYQDAHIIYTMYLGSFTEDETRAYLAAHGITDPHRVTTIWQLSQGLPLYLSLLTLNPQEQIDPTGDVVANFLRWIPEQESIKRQLALDAALLSRPFNQDDLEAFTYLPEQERPALYRWLIGLPFVHSSSPNGRYQYHELAQELFSRHLYQRSQRAYYATRTALASYYRRMLGQMSVDQVTTREWLELTLALAYQLFFLPDEASQIQAIEQMLRAYEHADQAAEIICVLRELSQERADKQLSAGARQTARHLLHYITADLTIRKQEALVSATHLLRKVAHEPAFPAELLAGLYRRRGIVYSSLNKHQQAIEDLSRALELNPNDAWSYAHRGLAYLHRNKYRRAIADFNRALELDSESALAYAGRGEAYRFLKEYQRAIADFDRALELEPKFALAYAKRGEIYIEDITERSELEERLRQSAHEVAEHASRLEAIFAAIADGVIVYDSEGRILRINETGRALFGLHTQPPEFLLRPLDERMPMYKPRNERGEPLTPEQWPGWRILHGEVLTGANSMDMIIQALDGRELQLNMSGAPVYDQDGQLVGGVLIVRDVTERRQLERELAMRAGKLKAMFEAALDGIITIDHDGRIIEFNPAAEQMFGYSRAEVLGQFIDELAIFPSLKKWHHHNLIEYLAKGSFIGRPVEMVARRTDGTELLVELDIARIPIDGLPMFTGYIHDITDRKRSEQILTVQYRVSRILAEAATFAVAAPAILQTIGESLRWELGMLWTVDANAYLLRCLQIWRASATTVTRLETERQQMSFPQGVGLPGHVWATGEPIWITDIAQADEFYQLQAAASEGWRSVAAFPVRNGGQILGIVELFSQETRPAHDDLLQMMFIIGRQIGLFIEKQQAEEERIQLLIQEQGARAEAEAATERLQCEITLMNQLASDLQDIVCAHAHQLPLNLELCNLATIVYRVVAEQRLAHPARTIILKWIPADGLSTGAAEASAIPVIGDAEAIGRVVTIYLINALMSSSTGQPVQVTLEVGEAVARVSVQDEGPGLSIVEQEQIWECPHHATTSEMLHDTSMGLGLRLGLYISRTIIERHHGQVGVQSIAGEGATFWFILPLARAG